MQDFASKTDAELARFCSVKSNALTRLQNKIDASPDPTPELSKEFDQTAEHLNAAIAELESRCT